MCLAATSELLRIAVSAVLVVVGWYVVYSLQSLRARRNVFRAHIQEVRQMLKRIRRDAIAFHTSSYNTQQNGELIESMAELDIACGLLGQIAQTSQRWLPNVVGTHTCTQLTDDQVRLRQAISLNHFDDPNQAALAASSTQISEIREAAQAILAQLDTLAVAALG